jgi:hypothetical protein
MHPKDFYKYIHVNRAAMRSRRKGNKKFRTIELDHPPP